MAVAALRELFSVGVTQLLQPPRGHGVPKQCEALVAVLDGHDHVQLQVPVELEELAVHVELSIKINTRCSLRRTRATASGIPLLCLPLVVWERRER